jgi:hypothetical protein
MAAFLPLAGVNAQEDFSVQEFLGFQPPALEQLRSDPLKTTLQTSVEYEPSIAIPVEGIIVHRHGAKEEKLARIMESWREKGYVVQRMFFADSDAGSIYTGGKFDGQEHPQDVEINQQGEVLRCAGTRPYMVPTRGWIDFLKEQVRISIEAGAQAIYPEEPLAHIGTGYEESFRQLFEQEYEIPWRGGDESPDAYYKTHRLKNKLYVKLEQELQSYTVAQSINAGREVEFFIPVHSMYSNLVSGLIAPLGTSLGIKGHQGYIGQVWTGPVRWCLDRTSDETMTIFDSAYLLYDYFVNLVKDSSKQMYLLGDPVEDDPNYSWDSYEQWYREGLTAKLLFPSIDTYEVMPWPSRVFRPGSSIAGGVPAPSEYRTTLMAALSVLQNIPAGTEEDIIGGSTGIGMLIGDSAMWQNQPEQMLDPFWGLLAPLLKQGIPVSSVPIERSGDLDYMNNFRLLLLSYEAWKPDQEIFHENLKTWVEQGGVLVIFDGEDSFDNIDKFWKEQGFPNPQAHLIDTFKHQYFSMKEYLTDVGVLYFERPVEKGHLIFTRVSPKSFARDKIARNLFLLLMREWMRTYLDVTLEEPEYLAVRRGDYFIVHTFDTEESFRGPFVDVLNPELPVIENANLKANESQVLLDVTKTLKSKQPRILFSTFRLMGQLEFSGSTTFFVKGPEKMEGRVRLSTAGRSVSSFEVRTPEGQLAAASLEMDPEFDSLLIRFPYNAEGLAFRIEWD